MSSEVPSVTVSEVGDDACFLDVREPDEWAAGHIPGAIHLPMSQLLDRLHEIPSDQHVVAVCRVGARSAQATAYLAQQRISIKNLVGGMQAWQAAGRPMVSESGEAPQVI
ncbi:MAG TPA: rhodanese-like domain-containing protein [Mycobacteriales bacterium]|nr:rhodanese-like domain-containing protein [Mycobacteriales bacterium]